MKRWSANVYYYGLGDTYKSPTYSFFTYWHTGENVKTFLNHKSHMAVLISISLAFSQAPVYTARPWTWRG